DFQGQPVAAPGNSQCGRRAGDTPGGKASVLSSCHPGGQESLRLDPQRASRSDPERPAVGNLRALIAQSGTGSGPQFKEQPDARPTTAPARFTLCLAKTPPLREIARFSVRLELWRATGSNSRHRCLYCSLRLRTHNLRPGPVSVFLSHPTVCYVT